MIISGGANIHLQRGEVLHEVGWTTTRKFIYPVQGHSSPIGSPLGVYEVVISEVILPV